MKLEIIIFALSTDRFASAVIKSTREIHADLLLAVILSLKYSKEGSLRLECIFVMVCQILVSILLQFGVDTMSGFSPSTFEVQCLEPFTQSALACVLSWVDFDLSLPL